VLLNAQFLAAVHVIVYAGAIMVLFLFTIMLLNLNKETEPQHSLLVKLAGLVAGGMLLVVMVGALRRASADTADDLVAVHGSVVGLVENLGKTLFRDFLLPFELSALLFLAAVVGAVVLGKKETGE
jgi:NADH-quinone oxidoreductase subunit J